MPSVELTKGPVPDYIKNRTREQFLAAENLGSLTGDDLYWVLYRAATETGASGSVDTFEQKVCALLDGKLGAGNYVLAIDGAATGDGGWICWDGTRLPNSQIWCGGAGVLPGFGEKYHIGCVVFWS